MPFVLMKDDALCKRRYSGIALTKSVDCIAGK
jgi:hypothetical protein